MRKDVVRRYVEDKQSIRQIARDLGCSYTTVHTVLTLAGVSKRPAKGAGRAARTTPATSTALS